LRLGDVAQVSRGWQTPVADIALIDGVPGVFVAARMQPTLRVDHWTENAKGVIERFNQTHQGTVTTKVVFDQNQYTAARLSDLSENLLLGSLVVMLVVFAFMGIKAALIVGLALPLSAAFTVLSKLLWSTNSSDVYFRYYHCDWFVD
jgi:multidrug efflux pump subunit AcrB